MKVENNVTLYVGAQPTNATAAEQAKNQENRKTVFAGNLNMESALQDRIAARKAEAKEKAMKIVSDAFAGEQTLDEEVESHKNKIASLKEERKALEESSANLTARQEDLRKAFENGEVTQEDYDKQSAELAEERKEIIRSQDENMGQMITEGRILYEIGQERLKSTPMLDAWNQADAALEAAGEEIIGMVTEGAQEKLDEDAKVREKQAEKIEEKKEAAEELIEKRKKRQEEQEELLEEMPVSDMISMDKMQEDVKAEVQDMLNKMKLIAEDIKGAAVDESL